MSIELFTTTRWMRSSSVRPDSGPCMEPRCRETGDGTHVFCYADDPEAEGSLIDGKPEHLRDSSFWLSRALAQFPDGTRVRITVEAAAKPRIEPIPFMADDLDLATHSLTGWPKEGVCSCGARAVFLSGMHDDATYECRGTSTDFRSAYGPDRCGRVFTVVHP